MPIKLSSRILLTKDAQPSNFHDQGGVIIEGEDDEDVNPFVCDRREWMWVLKGFGTGERWALPGDDGDERFTCFIREPPNMLRPKWLSEFLSYGRKMRSEFKSKGNWRQQQPLLKRLVMRFFDRSKAQQTKRSLFRASIVLGLFLICDRKSTSMTNMVLHLARSCSPPERSTTKPVRVSRPATKDDIQIVIKNQETLFLMSLKIAARIEKLIQDLEDTSDQEANEAFESVHYSDDSATVTEGEVDVEDEVED